MVPTLVTEYANAKLESRFWSTPELRNALRYTGVGDRAAVAPRSCAVLDT